jgi:hypothetical protein
MRLAKEMLRATPTAILKRAKQSTVVQFAVTPDYDQLNRPHAYIVGAVVCAPPNGTGKLHSVEARLYNPMTNAPTWVSCDCGSHRYTWEVALTNQQSSSKRCSNGKQPTCRNPRNIPGLCKHLARFLSKAITSAAVRKVLFGFPAKEIKRIRQEGLMNKRGIPEKLPKKGFCKPPPKKSKKPTRPEDRERPKILPSSQSSLPPGGAPRCK